MKLIVKSDDYGMTEAISCGILRGIREGGITCTGAMTVLPSSEISARWIKDNRDVCLGIDINIVNGRPNAPIAKVKSLVEPDGEFIRSGKRLQLDKQSPNGDHLILEETLIEVEAQVQQFIGWYGRVPDYLATHSYRSPTLDKAHDIVAGKYGLLQSRKVAQEYGVYVAPQSWIPRPYTFEAQVAADPLDCILSGKLGLLDHDVSMMTMHCGYVDAEIFYWSTLNFVRLKDLGAVISPEFKKWVKDNKVELISFNDLKKQG
jgi:predicted glycoside hydrolase/deacetylase ChbG (UPF0249 family)